MKSITKNWVYLIAFLLITTAGFSQDKETKLEDKEKWELVEMQGTITEINKETREISIIGSKGELHTVTAGEEVERFDDI